MRKGYRALITIGVTAITAGALSTFHGPTIARASGPAITFGVPSIVDPVNTVGEPDLAVDRSGHVFVSGPAGTGEQRSIWEGSSDGGATYRKIGGLAPSAIEGINNAPGGGDTDIAFSNASRSTQTQYFNDLYALAGLRVATTGDEGATISQQVDGAGGAAPEVDRQWFAVYDPTGSASGSCSVSTSLACGSTTPIVYIAFGPGSERWTRSTDGLTYVSANPNNHFGSDGYPSIDQVTGDVFEASYGGSSDIKLNIGKPNDTAGDLTFLDDTGGPGPITVAPSIIDNAGDVANFVVSSMDSKRNLYVAYVDRSTTPSQRQVFVTAAPANNSTLFNGCLTNCWNHWTTPVQVSDGSAVTGDNVNVFPWIKAGGPGLTDTVWYGDSTSLDPSDTTAGHVWNVFMDQTVWPTDPTTGAITGAAPTKNLVKVTPHPMDYLDVCLQGTGCALNTTPGNRNLADFFEVNIDNSGAAEIVYDDMSNGLIQQPQPSTTIADHAGAPVISVIRQNGGPGLLGSAVTGPSTGSISGLPDPSGDALYPVIGGPGNLDAMDFVNDPGTHLASSLSLSGSTLTVTMKVANLNNLAAVASATGGSIQEFITRWQMGNTIYYAEAYMASSMSTALFSAGKAQSVDLCSVSLCLPRVIIYPEAGTGATGTNIENTGSSATCPTSPSASNPCTITISVNTADIGSPASTSLLEEVGAYAVSTSHLQFGTSNAQGQADNVPLEIDGVCCYNFQASTVPVSVPETPWGPALIGSGVFLVGAGVIRRRRHRAGSM